MHMLRRKKCHSFVTGAGASLAGTLSAIRVARVPSSASQSVESLPSPILASPRKRGS